MSDYDLGESPPYDNGGDFLPSLDRTEALVVNVLADAAKLLERGRNTSSFARGLRLLRPGKVRDIYLDGYSRPWGQTLQQIVDGGARREAVFELARSLRLDYPKEVDFIAGKPKDFPANPHAVLTMAMMFLRMEDNKIAADIMDRRIDVAFRLVDVWSELNRGGEQGGRRPAGG